MSFYSISHHCSFIPERRRKKHERKPMKGRHNSRVSSPMLAPFFWKLEVHKVFRRRVPKGKESEKKSNEKWKLSYPQNFPDDEVSRAATLKIFAPIYYSTKHVDAAPKFIEVFKYFAKVVSNVMKTWPCNRSQDFSRKCQKIVIKLRFESTGLRINIWCLTIFSIDGIVVLISAKKKILTLRLDSHFDIWHLIPADIAPPNLRLIKIFAAFFSCILKCQD